MVAEFYDGDHGFGIIRKGRKHHPSSDFLFNFIAEVICSDSRSSGFMIELTPGRFDGVDSEYKR